MFNLKFRSIFISDLHMGTKNCKADFLLDFLKRTDSEYLYLVGDIFDLWEMKSRVHWTHLQNEIVEEIFQKAENGTKVIYIPGNHDSWFRRFKGANVRGVTLQLSAVHITEDERKFFVSHGDEFDMAVRHNRVLKFLGDHFYSWLLILNRLHKAILCKFDKPYWSLSTWIKTRVSNANQYINKFETVSAKTAYNKGYDGYICGHIHLAEIKDIEGVLYCNSGDWVEECTALVENNDGWMSLLHWSDHALLENAISRQTNSHNDQTVVEPPVMQ